MSNAFRNWCLGAGALFCAATAAHADGGPFPGPMLAQGSFVAGHCLKSGTQVGNYVQDTGSACAGGSGSVTSVGLVLPSIFTVTVSPITTSGNLTATLNTEAANRIFAGPGSGADAGPTFRALVGADLPLPGVSSLGGVFSKAAVTHSFLTSISSVNGSIGQAQPAFTDLSGSASCSQLPALTGDVTTSSCAATLATVNGNVGTFQGITVNAKGLVTAAADQHYITANQTITISSDCTGSGATSIALICTKTNGVAFGALATLTPGTGIATWLTTPNSANLAAAVTDETGSGLLVFATSPVLTTPNLGTPSALVLTNATGLPVGSLTGLGANVGAWLVTPSSANLAAALTDETGSGLAVFGTSPSLTTPTIAGGALSGTFSGAPTLTGLLTTNFNAGSPPTILSNTAYQIDCADSAGCRIEMNGWTSNPVFNLRTANGTNAAPTQLALNDVVGNIGGLGCYGGPPCTLGTASRASIRFMADEAWVDSTHNAMGLSIFATPAASATSAQTARFSSNVFHLGPDPAATPAGQSIECQSATGTNHAGADCTFNASQGTGTGAGGNFVFRTAPVGTTGSAANALATTVTIASLRETVAGGITFGNALTVNNPGLAGFSMIQTAANLTDSGTTGTTAAAYGNVSGGNTILATNTKTYTNWYSSYFKDDTCGTGATCTAKWALGADSLRVNGVITASAQIYANGSTVRVGQFTVSGLPSAATAGAGAQAYVTDAIACTFLSTITGGGSTGCPVVSNGTTWNAG